MLLYEEQNLHSILVLLSLKSKLRFDIFIQSSRQLCATPGMYSIFQLYFGGTGGKACVCFAYEQIVFNGLPAKTGAEHRAAKRRTNFACPHCFQSSECQRLCTQRMDSALCFSVLNSTFFLGQGTVRVPRQFGASDFRYLHYNFLYLANLAFG